MFELSKTLQPAEQASPISQTIGGFLKLCVDLHFMVELGTHQAFDAFQLKFVNWSIDHGCRIQRLL